MEQKVVVRVRENPAKRRERVARISRALSMTVVKTGPEDRRGLLFGRIVAAGLRALRPQDGEDISGAVLEAAAAAALTAVAGEGADPDELRAQIARLRAQLPLARRIPAEDLEQMRAWRAEGRTYKAIAEATGFAVEQVRYLLGAKKRGGSSALLGHDRAAGLISGPPPKKPADAEA